MNVLTLEKLRKDYRLTGTVIEVLRGVDLTVERGEVVAIIGPSGSGKSTLLSLLAGLDQPSAGEVRVMGTALNRLSEADLTHFRAKNLGIVFQQFHLLSNLTALENVTLPLEILGMDGALERAQGALEQVGLDKRLTHFPHLLSGGECQRVAIARAMVIAPALLLADEPSGNLDTATGRQVMTMLFKLVRAHTGTMVLVTHNEELASWCDRRMSLQEGRLVDVS